MGQLFDSPYAVQVAFRAGTVMAESGINRTGAPPMVDSRPMSAGHDPRAVVPRAGLAGVSAISCALLMTELALTRIFSVTMYYHFAFLAISIALFGLSASGVAIYLARRRLDRYPTATLLTGAAVVYAVVTLLALAFLVRIRVGLNYSPANLLLMLAIYASAALPFFAGGAVISLAISRWAPRINVVYAADLLGAASGCLLLIPLLDRLGAPGVVFAAAALALSAAALLARKTARKKVLGICAAVLAIPGALQWAGAAPFDVLATKGHVGDRVLFSKWNSFSRVAVYDRAHGDWSLSPSYHGRRPESLFMDIDSAASTPILHASSNLADVDYLRYELTALGYYLVGNARSSLVESRQPDGRLPTDGPQNHGFNALVIGPGGGRDLLTALVFGASRVDGVEINPIIARDVMESRYRAYAGDVYTNPRVRIHVDDGRSFVRASDAKYDLIQASLVDTWAATAAGAYTLTENSLYTVEAFEDYIDHLNDDGVLTITRWVFDGLRLVSLAQEACAARGLHAPDHLAVVQFDRVATFLLKRSAFTPDEVGRLRQVAGALGFTVLYAPGAGVASGLAEATPPEMQRTGTSAGDYARLILSTDRERFFERYPLDVRPTTDDRPFFFHTTKLADQFGVAFGRSMLFGNGLSALLTLMAISLALVTLFILGPLLVGGEPIAARDLRWVAYFGALGAGFMLIEVALLQRFVLLLGHPVYSLTVTLFSMLLGTGIGSLLGRRVHEHTLARVAAGACAATVAMAALATRVYPVVIASAIAAPRPLRMLLATALILPAGIVMGLPLPTGMRLLAAHRRVLVPWAWGINGALSVVGATLAVFIAMNWGFSATLLAGAGVYLGAAALIVRR